MTGAERSWASRYEINDVLRYARGSKSVGIEPGDYGTVVSINSAANLLTVDKSTDELATYDPRRLTGVNVYREVTQAFAAGDRIQFTAPDKSRRDGSFEEQQIQKQNLHELFSGLASLPVLRTDLVLQHHMLTDQQLNTAVVVTRTTPGPVGIVLVLLTRKVESVWVVLTAGALELAASSIHLVQRLP